MHDDVQMIPVADGVDRSAKRPRSNDLKEQESDYVVLWGADINRMQLIAAGSLHQPTSRLLRPMNEPTSWPAVRRLFPSDIFPQLCDTADSLSARLSATTFLDDLTVREPGGAGRVRLNESVFPQPRRALWGAIDEESSKMFVYPR